MDQVPMGRDPKDPVWDPDPKGRGRRIRGRQDQSPVLQGQLPRRYQDKAPA
ncbi:hypothetical protein D3C81_2339300 [compost metagenome]